MKTYLITLYEHRYIDGPYGEDIEVGSYLANYENELEAEAMENAKLTSSKQFISVTDCGRPNETRRHNDNQKRNNCIF